MATAIERANAPALEPLVDRLSAYEPSGDPVLSVYIDTRPDEHGKDHFQPFLRKELRARGAAFAPHTRERESYERDAERIREWAKRELRPSANSAALFCCSGSGLFEAVQLEAPIEQSRLHVGPQPHIYPLVRLLERFPRYAALIADTHLARLFVFGLHAPLRQQTVTSPKGKRHDMGGWSQLRFQRHVDDSYRRHAMEVVLELEKLVRAEGIDRVVIAGDEVIVPLLRDQLPPHLQSKVVDVLALDIRTPEREVLIETLEALRRRSAETEAEKVRQLLDEYRAGGLAVLGLRETEAALALGQVHELFLGDDPVALREVEPDSPPPGPPDPSLLEERTGLADRLVRLARRTGASVTMVGDRALLADVGGVGASLRYRLELRSGDARQG
jgi:peptide chain release factor subunit 1